MMGPVDEGVIQRLEGIRPAWKREWEALLRSEPTLSPLGNPDTLVFLMDETMSAVLKALRHRPTKPTTPNAHALLAPLQRHCDCGLNPLLNYYATGELALHLVAAKSVAEHLDEVLIAYHLMAQREIDTLCAVCQHRATPDCATPEIAGTVRPHHR